MSYKLLFTLILILTFILRLIAIDSLSGLTYDELFFWNIVINNDYIGIIKELINSDYHPPLYLFTLKFWITLFGDSDITLHLLSVLYSSLCAWVVYLIGKSYKNKQFGLFLMLAYTVSFVFIQEAQTVRFYQLSLFLAFLSILFTVKILQKQKTKYYIALAIVNILLLYTQTTGLIFIGVEALLLLLFHIQYYKHYLKIYLKTCAYSLIALIPQILMFAIQYIHSKQTFWHNPWEWSGIFVKLKCLINNFILILYPFYIKNIPNYVYILVVLILFAGIFYLAFRHKDRKLLFISLFSVLYSTLYFTLQCMHILTSGCNVNYLLLGLSLFFLAFYFALSKIKKIFIISFIIFNTFITLPALSSNYYKIKLNKVTFGSISTYILYKKYNNALIFNLYGDDLIKKYSKDFNTFGLNADKMFTMKNWENEFSKISNVDLANYSQKQRYEYILNILNEDVVGSNLSTLYNNKIESLDLNSYFIVISPKNRVIHSSVIKSIVNNELDYKYNSKSLLMVAKLNNDILKLVYSDSRMNLIEQKLLFGNWYIFVFKKVK